MTTLAARLRNSNLFPRPPSPQLIPIRDLICQVAGIFQPDDRLEKLQNRCQARMSMLGLTTLKEYYERLTAEPIRRTELVKLLNEITVGETSFFRNQPQLDTLRDVVLDRIVEVGRKRAWRHLKIWSAGCSTGEEPYTVSIMLMEIFGEGLQGWTFEIVATDLNEYSVAHAQAGMYNSHSTRDLAPELAHKYFSGSADSLQVNDEVKSRVSITRANLLDDDQMLSFKDFDIVICCNVLIYFDTLSKRRVIQHFSDSLLPHGYLFLGHSESLLGLSKDFRLIAFPSANGYIKSAWK
jgi:chemotaxis protein methyltransferase CheR